MYTMYYNNYRIIKNVLFLVVNMIKLSHLNQTIKYDTISTNNKINVA